MAAAIQATADVEAPPAAEKADIAAMVAAAKGVQQAFGEEAANTLTAQIEAARRKRDEARPHHVRLKEAEQKADKAKEALALASEEVDRLQDELRKATDSQKEAKEKADTADKKFAEQRAAAATAKL